MTTSPYTVLTHLGDIDTQTFLRDYWQKKPLLVKNALPNFINPLEADEIGGLSLDEESQARLVFRPEQGKSATPSWEVKHGPFTEQDFSALPEHDWTLLVQHADSLDPDVNALLNAFRFLPNWRLDDIMVSFATDGAGVGPHFDYYDVFLLQGSGKRRWRIGQWCDEKSELLENQSMRILKNFDTKYDWETEAGDLIYIPARLAHWGESVGESITYSIGFRAPSHAEILLDGTQFLSEHLSEAMRYADGSEIANGHPIGLIPKQSIEQIQSTLSELVSKPEQLAKWLAEYSTQLKQGIEPESLPLPFIDADELNTVERVALSSFCRVAYFEQAGSTACCYINGHEFSMSLSLAEILSSYEPVTIGTLSDEELNQLATLALAGVLVNPDAAEEHSF